MRSHRQTPRRWTDPQRAVLLAAAIEPPAAAVAELRALAPALDWDATVDLAMQLGVAPLVHRTLQRARLEVPEVHRLRLFATHGMSAIRNDAIMAEVLRITRALDEAGIPSVPLKGAGLMVTLYPDVALRTFGDIDLLVPDARHRAAGTVLVALGYTQKEDDPQRERAERFHHHLTFTHTAPSGRFHLELHHRLITSFLRRLDSEAVLTRARPCTYGQGQIRCLELEDEVLYCACHLMRHVAGPHLRWLVDLGELVARPALDWDIVVARARAWGAGTALYEALRRLTLVLGVEVPASVLARVRPTPMVRALFTRLAPPAVALGEGLPGTRSRHVLSILLQEGIADRLLFIGHRLGRDGWFERAPRTGA